jgi:hypothetical protein
MCTKMSFLAHCAHQHLWTNLDAKTGTNTFYRFISKPRKIFLLAVNMQKVDVISPYCFLFIINDSKVEV